MSVLGKVKIELNLDGVRALRKSESMQEGLEQLGSQIAMNAGEGFGYKVKDMPTRAVGFVYPETIAASRSNMKNNTLLKALQ